MSTRHRWVLCVHILPLLLFPALHLVVPSDTFDLDLEDDGSTFLRNYRFVLNDEQRHHREPIAVATNRRHDENDWLESEHGVFDRDVPVVATPSQSEYHQQQRPKRRRKFVYLTSSKDRFTFNPGSASTQSNYNNYYTVNKPQQVGTTGTTGDGVHNYYDEAHSFSDKLNEFIASVHYQKHNNSAILGIVPSTTTTTTTTTTTQRPHGADADRYATRNRLNRLLRNYLVRMHRRKYGDEAQMIASANALPAIQSEYGDYVTDTSLAAVPRPNMHQLHQVEGSVGEIGKRFDSAGTYRFAGGNNMGALDVEGKFLQEPLAQIKNKTLRFANKFLSLFTVIQFENFKCQATGAMGAYEGTCYLPNECADKGGTELGKCASGHGVCCVFKNTCGSSSSNNCTYFESPNYPDYFPGGGSTLPPGTTMSPLPVPDPRDKYLDDMEVAFGALESRQTTSTEAAWAMNCVISITKTNANVKQMRIDFIDLELKGPTNGTCVDERLVITGTTVTNQVPVICGYNTGSHVYVDVSGLTGPLMLAVLSTTGERKRFKIRVCQYEDMCGASQGCLQYYTGLEGYVSTFNYDKAASFSRSDPGYFNNLNYAICIKKEPGYCSVTYSTTDPAGTTYPFQLDNFDETGMRTVPAGQAGVGVFNCPEDYIVMNGIRLCGQRLNDGSVIVDFTRNAPVTDFGNGPIVIPVRTSARATGRGFKLYYMQNRCRT